MVRGVNRKDPHTLLLKKIVRENPSSLTARGDKFRIYQFQCSIDVEF